MGLGSTQAAIKLLSATVQPSAAGTITTECTYGIATDCTFCGEARKNDPDMYFFYDTTSLGRQEVIDTHNVVETWITGLRDLGAFNGKVYHTSVLGERWLDWAIVPFTGQFNNAGYCGGSYSPGVGTGSVIGPQNPSWGNNPPTGGYVDAVTPPTSNTNTIEWGVLDYFINVKEIDWFNGGNTTSTVTYTGTGSNGTVQHGLSSAPELVIVKQRDDANHDWQTGSDYLASWAHRLKLNDNVSSSSVSTSFNLMFHFLSILNPKYGILVF